MIFEKSKRFRVELARKEVGARIAKARRTRGWTQKDLAGAMGVSWHTVVGWEGGGRFPATRFLGTLANCLRRSLDLIVLNRARGAKYWKLMVPPERTGGGGFRALPVSTAADPPVEVNDSTPSAAAGALYPDAPTGRGS